jgi:hypothetical protein
MVGRVKVFRRVLVFRGVATADVAAGKTEPQVNPRVAQLHALSANMLIGGGELDLIGVFAIHV